jgi:plasmid maintenance system antidote protein VapI
MSMTANEFAPVTPGEMLRQEFLTEYRLSQNQLAKALGIRQTGSPKLSPIAGALQQTLLQLVAD